VIGTSDDAETQKLLASIRSEFYIPNKVLIHIDPTKPPTTLAEKNETVKSLIEGLEVAPGVSLRICESGVCGMPITGFAEARKAILGD
jgi:hypothetical protein